MALDDFATFVNEEFGLVGGGGGTAEPAAGMGAASMFCSSKGGFGIGMQEAPYDVFLFLDGMASLKGRAVIATAPDIVRDSRDGRGGVDGVLRVHGPKDILRLCQTMAESGNPSAPFSYEYY